MKPCSTMWHIKARVGSFAAHFHARRIQSWMRTIPACIGGLDSHTGSKQQHRMRILCQAGVQDCNRKVDHTFNSSLLKYTPDSVRVVYLVVSAIKGMLMCRYVMGYVSTVFFLVFTIMMMLLGEEQAKGAHERLTHHEDA